MLLEVLFAIHADPVDHLGCRSLIRLEAFEYGYRFCCPVCTKDYEVEHLLRDWVSRLYPAFAGSAMGAHRIIQEASPNDETAFDLFFRHLETVLVAHPDVLLSPKILKSDGKDLPYPVSALLGVVTLVPSMYLPKHSPGVLRAFLDGARLACIEVGHIERADLDGFEHWIRRALYNRKGMFRWENAVLSHFQGREKESFDWALDQLKQYRSSIDPPSEWKFEVVHHKSSTIHQFVRAGECAASDSAGSS